MVLGSGAQEKRFYMDQIDTFNYNTVQLANHQAKWVSILGFILLQLLKVYSIRTKYACKSNFKVCRNSWNKIEMIDMKI